MTENIKNIAFIGLGKMGKGMAANILKAGFNLTVYNRTRSKTEPLSEQGADVADTPRQAATYADVVITSLYDDESVLDVVLGDNGILSGLKKSGVHVSTSTISPDASRKIYELHREHGSHYVAAPVLGRPDAAAAGQLATFLSGDPDAIELSKKVCESYTKKIYDLGGEDPGKANSVKLSLNYVLASTIELFGQLYSFGEKSGIDPEFMGEMFDLIFSGPIPKAYAKKIRERDFDGEGFALEGGYKDIELILKASYNTRSPLSYANIIRDKLMTALAYGMDQKDWSSIYEISRMNANLK